MTTNLTRRGISKDLVLSPYTFTYKHNDNEVILSFSSKLHLNNFIKNRDKNYAMIYNYIIKRFKYKTDPRILSDLNLYQKIEHRGFYIKINDKVYRDIKQILIK